MYIVITGKIQTKSIQFLSSATSENKIEGKNYCHAQTMCVGKSQKKWMKRVYDWKSHTYEYLELQHGNLKIWITMKMIQIETSFLCTVSGKCVIWNKYIPAAGGTAGVCDGLMAVRLVLTEIFNVSFIKRETEEIIIQWNMNRIFTPWLCGSRLYRWCSTVSIPILDSGCHGCK